MAVSVAPPTRSPLSPASLPFMRRLVTDADFRAGFADMLPASLAIAPFGIVCGVGAAAAGSGVLGALGLSAIVFSGAAQILAVQLLAAGAPLAGAILGVIAYRVFNLWLPLLPAVAALPAVRRRADRSPSVASA